VAEAKLGLRDYAWVNESLPGKVGGMDVDFTVNQAATDRALMLEFKPEGAYLSTGHRLTFRLFVRKGIDVWVLWEQKDGTVKVAGVNAAGHTPIISAAMPRVKVAQLIREWWDEGLT
jgi:hypothetical protein